MWVLLAVVASLLAAPTALASPETGSRSHETDPGGAGPGAAQVGFTYEVGQRGVVSSDPAHFEAVVGSTLDARVGWARAGADFQPVTSGGDFTVILASPAEIDAAHEVCSPSWSCRVGNQVLINDVRWQEGTTSWTETLAEYRSYVVNHEVGHWLGLGHSDCPSGGAPAPVMQQQSIDLQGCVANVWPLDWEIEAVADIHGTTPTDPVPGARGVEAACGPVDLDAPEHQLPDIGGYGQELQDAARCAVAYEVVQGYADGTYRPEDDIRRHEMAQFLARVLGYAEAAGAVQLPADPSDPFEDVASVPPEARSAIALLHELGVTMGTSSTTYEPYGPVSRRDMASFVVRTQEVVDPQGYATGQTLLFPDVRPGLARDEHINALATEGIVQGFEDGTYRPFTSVDRGQMALFVMRHVDENVAAGRLPPAE